MSQASTTQPETSDDQTGLAKAYDPAAIEAGLYDRWDSAGYFAPRHNPDRTPFVMMMPPPNLTGELHVGHAMFVTIEDVMARWHRMKGDPTLWLPGADHAGIAGQWAVEKIINAEGLTRHDLGRDAFVQRTWAFMNQLRGRVREQMRILGASCDWSRFQFTMDAGPSLAVRTVFKHLYDKGLIYRGRRIISWCPRCMTALSDLEVEHKDETGSLWHLAYSIDESETGETVVVATSRPETMLGDTGVAVHPDDERYRHLIGTNARLPIVGRLIPIVADDAVDPAFGTGAVKVTPAHDPNDFDIGSRHGLPFVTVLNLDATMTDDSGAFAGMTREVAREAVVGELTALGALVKTEAHKHSVGHCFRCDTTVEPMVSDQWFTKMAPLAAPAIAAARDGRLTFVPDRFTGVYLNWLENIHDWCISRQLWWGHRIPVWYCRGCGETTVSTAERVEACPACGGPVEQDPDVLDAWFSSGLWPFSTLGWPAKTDDLARFYPGSVMETGYDIIFFWVSRMVFFGLEIMGEVPFHTIYLHGLVRDDEGQKMSKTKGNVLDPTSLVEEYGADALRFSLITQATPGNDSRLSRERIEESRNFANKLWNATRFALRPIEESGVQLDERGPVRPGGDLALADRWILSRLDAVTAEANRLFDGYLFGEAGRQIRDFIRSELCDWYIEAAKARLRGTPDEKVAVAQALAYVLDRSMRLLHPFMPFITEALWHELPHLGESVMVAEWPAANARDLAAEADFGLLIDLVSGIRAARSESNVEPGRWIAADVYAGSRAAALESARRELGALARIADGELRLMEGAVGPMDQSLTVIAQEVVAYLPLAGMVDLEAERERLRKEIAAAEAEVGRAQAMLGNDAFVAKAPEKVIGVQRERLATASDQAAILRHRLLELA